MATHITRTHPRRQWTGCTADRDTRQKKRVEAQKRKPKVLCDDRALKNVWAFVYLGAKFSADGDPTTDVKARIAKALMRICCHTSQAAQNTSEEASGDTTTFNLLWWIRARRMKWMGHIVRLKADSNGNERLVKQAVRHIHAHKRDGDLLMYVDVDITWADLQKQADNREKWKERVAKMRAKAKGETWTESNAAVKQ